MFSYLVYTEELDEYDCASEWTICCPTLDEATAVIEWVRSEERTAYLLDVEPYEL